MAQARNDSSRNRSRRGPVCGFTFDDVSCPKRGDHFCQQRADHTCAFFSELLMHTKGRWARKPFHLADWQADDLIRPVFGTVTWSPDDEIYVRRYRILWIEVGRKNGKSELMAGIALYLLCADDEEGAEIYGCLDPSTPILCDDLTWRPISALRPGDRVVAMDEEPPAGGQRKMRTAEVVNSWPTRKRSVRVTLANGRSLVCSADHRWLSSTAASNRRIWRPAGRLREGDSVLDILDPWTVGDTRDHGYLAGLLDGEGSFHAPRRSGAAFRLNFTQNPGVVLDGYREVMKRLGFEVASSRVKPGGCVTDVVTGLRETMRLLGEVRPTRLLARHKELWEGRCPKGRMTSVVAVEDLGERNLWDIETTTGTYIADGVLSHNCAKDRDQARKVFDVAKRMVQLSPILSRRLKIFDAAKRIVDERTGSYYEVVAADAAGNLGHNPHGVVFDEVLTQPNGDLWEAFKTGMGTRAQPLMVAATTAGNDPAAFAKAEHDDMTRILEDPARSPRTFVYIRNVPKDADPWDESLWPLGNPALGTFLKIETLRDEAREARDNSRKENAFRQYRLNQWVQQTTRFISLDEWDANAGDTIDSPDELADEYEGQQCWAGLDLSSKLDLTAWTLVFPDGTCIWRFWIPESVVPTLDKHTDGKFSQWVRDGWVTATEGDVIDYSAIYDAIEEDHNRFAIESVTYDKWSGEPVRQEIEERTGIETFVESSTTYERMTAPMQELARSLKAGELRHGGNPVARWMADSLEAKSPSGDPERMRPVKPDRAKSGKRIDGMVSLLLALDGRLTIELPPAAADIF